MVLAVAIMRWLSCTCCSIMLQCMLHHTVLEVVRIIMRMHVSTTGVLQYKIGTGHLANLLWYAAVPWWCWMLVWPILIAVCSWGYELIGILCW